MQNSNWKKRTGSFPIASYKLDDKKIATNFLTAGIIASFPKALIDSNVNWPVWFCTTDSLHYQVLQNSPTKTPAITTVHLWQRFFFGPSRIRIFTWEQISWEQNPMRAKSQQNSYRYRRILIFYMRPSSAKTTSSFSATSLRHSEALSWSRRIFCCFFTTVVSFLYTLKCKFGYVCRVKTQIFYDRIETQLSGQSLSRDRFDVAMASQLAPSTAVQAYRYMSFTAQH